MSEIDLIPADYAREQRTRRHLLWLGAGVLALACVVGVARGALGVLLSAEKEQVARLQHKKVIWQQAKARTEKFSNEAQVTQKQLDALDGLRGREHLRLFLLAVDHAYVEKVWFDEIRYYRREQPPLLVPGQKPPAAPAFQPMEQRAGMVGHALNHATLAEFMRRMEGQPAIAELNLVDTSPRNYPHALVIDFKLALLLEHKPKGHP
jgi:hypothetical protein